MNRPWLRAAQKLQFCDPTQFLIDFRKIEIEAASSDLPEKVKSLRGNTFKKAREQRQAALFCHGMSERVGKKIYFAAHDDQDFDFIASWVDDGYQHFHPIQLKEVVPYSLNPKASIESVIDGLGKYTDSSELTVAVHLNQNGRFDPQSLNLQHLKVASFWVFSGAERDQSKWYLWGNFTEKDPLATMFTYPIPNK